MVRAFSILLGGIAAAVGAAVLIAPGWRWVEVVVPVLVTTTAGLVVLALTARRAAVRDAAERLAAREQLAAAGIDLPTETTDASPDATEEPDRG